MICTLSTDYSYCLLDCLLHYAVFSLDGFSLAYTTSLASFHETQISYIKKKKKNEKEKRSARG